MPLHSIISEMMCASGQQFGSATSFSIHCKRQQTPNKQGDDGWKSVMYEGQPLETFRKTFVSHAGSAETLPEEVSASPLS